MKYTFCEKDQLIDYEKLRKEVNAIGNKNGRSFYSAEGKRADISSDRNGFPHGLSVAIIRVLCVLLLAVYFFAGFFEAEVYADSGFKIYDYSTKKTTVYNGIVPIVTLNGNKIGDDRAKPILVNGIALLPYDIFFEKSLIAADCSYDKSKESVTISKYGKKITLTVGSKKAVVNGKTVTMSVAPMKVKYVDSGLTKILVPSRFVSENLGLGYTWYSSQRTIAIEKKTITLSYNNEAKFEYSDMQTKVTIDGVDLDLGKMPGIIVNNIAMLRAKRVFADSSIGASYSYNKSSKKITLKKDDKVLVMTIGSKIAYLNDKKIELDNAPMVVTNHETATSYVMVPGRNTATSLGYDYVWDKAAQTSRISSKNGSGSNTGNSTDKSTNGGNSGNNQAPELGDDSVYDEPGTVLAQWQADDLAYGSCSGVHELTGNVVYNTIVGQVYYASNDYIKKTNNSDTFMFVSNMPFADIVSDSNAGLINISVKNFSCVDQVFQLNESLSSTVNYITMYNNPANNEAIIQLSVIAEDYQYDISLTDDRQILYVTVYKNTVIKAVLGLDGYGDYISIYGMSPLQAEISDYTGQIHIKLPGVVNGLGEFSHEIAGARFIRHMVTTSGDNATHIILVADPGYEYFLAENGNVFTLYLKEQNYTENQPDNSSDNQPGKPSGNQSGNQTGSQTGNLPDDDEPEHNTPIADKSSFEIIIPRPANLKNSMISDEDFYHEGYFVIRLKGDYVSFYNNNKIKYTSANIKNIVVSLNKDGETEIRVYTSKLQGYRIVSDNETICVDVGDPRQIYKNIVVLDPGHGGSADGAKYFGSKEKDINLKILYTVGKKYFNSDTSKLKVYYTRYTDVDISLNDRAAFAKKVGADLFVSLHMNAVVKGAESVRGSEVFYSEKNNSPNSAGLSSKKLAEILNTSICTNLGTKNRGVKEGNLVVTAKNTVPAVLIELGFMSNKDEHALLTNEEFQDKAARVIYETLLEVFEKYPTGR